MVKGSGVMQIVFSMKSRVEIMETILCARTRLLKVLSHLHVAEDASESAFIISGIPGRTR